MSSRPYRGIEMEPYTTLSVTSEVAAEIRDRREAAGDATTSDVLEELLKQADDM
jgi:hypothetical protein